LDFQRALDTNYGFAQFFWAQSNLTFLPAHPLDVIVYLWCKLVAPA